jgi:AcrR family transcriptional regulator
MQDMPSRRASASQKPRAAQARGASEPAGAKALAAVRTGTATNGSSGRKSTARPRERGNARRNDIIRAAAETFYRKGYGATTTQDIADAVGMLKGSLYYYITAKEDLLYEIIDEVHELLAKNLDVVAAMDGDPLARIWTLVHHNVIGNAQNLINSAVFFRDFSALTGRRRKHIIALRDKGDAMLRELIVEGQRAGLIRGDVDPKLAATAINTMCNALYHWYRPEGELTPDEVAQSYADLAVASLTANPKKVVAARTAAQQRLAREGDQRDANP